MIASYLEAIAGCTAPRDCPSLTVRSQAEHGAGAPESTPVWNGVDACVIAGRRRYTRFPAEQVANLWVGPLEFRPAGQAISLVDFHRPDRQRFPRFREALAHAEVTELGPGDALDLPSLWLHHAESLDPFLMLNYWWRTAPAYMFTPYVTMLYALLTIRGLPPCERQRWRAFFDHYIFQTGGDPMAHAPMDARGAFATMTPSNARSLLKYLQESLGRRPRTRARRAATGAARARALWHIRRTCRYLPARRVSLTGFSPRGAPTLHAPQPPRASAQALLRPRS